MGKVKQLRTKAVAKAGSKHIKVDRSVNRDGGAQSRGQRKRQHKKAHIMRKIGLSPAVLTKGQKNSAKKTEITLLDEDSSAKFSDLEVSLKSSGVPNANVKPASVVDFHISSSKMKRSVAVREIERMKLVQQHSGFQNNPFAIMKSHLEQMVSHCSK